MMAKTAPSVLTLDNRIRDPRVTNVSYGAPVTLLDYQIALWNPSDLLEHYTHYRTYQGRPSLAEDSSFRIVRDVDRRRKEMRQFLALGKTLVLFLPPPTGWFVATGDEQYSGTGRNQQVTTLVRPMSIGDAFPVKISPVEATGERMALVAGDPFASFWRGQKEFFYYRSYMEQAVGTPAAVIEDTDYAVASIAGVEKGTVLILPQPAHETKQEETAFLDAIFELVDKLRARSGDFTLPAWAKDVKLPRENPALEDLAKVEQRLAELLTEIDQRKQEVAVIRERKVLFTGDGPALEKVAEQAFKALGYAVEPGRPGRTDRLIRLGGRAGVAEIKGKAKSAAESDAAQLEKWVTEYRLEHDQQPKGLLVVNAWKGKPLKDRAGEAFPHQMLGYSQSRGHCLITGLQLLGAWLDAEAHPNRKDEIAASIFDCVGIYPNYADWRQFLDEESAADAVKQAPPG